MEALENVPGALEVVLEAMSGQDSSRQALDIENLEKHEENPGFFVSHRSVLEASWRLLGGVLEALEGVLKASWKRLGDHIENLEKHKENQCFLACHRSVLEASWGVLEALGGVLEALEGVLKASWRRLGDQHEPRCHKNRKRCQNL